MIYLLDTNAITDLTRNVRSVVAHSSTILRQGHSLALCPPTYYENLRGLLKVNATSQIARLQGFKTVFDWQPLDEEDWLQAAHYWSNAISAGRQLSDMDFLIAALSHRFDATIVSADTDFDALPVKREDWRVSAP